MAYGLPTIVPPVGGIVELIEDKKNGYLIDSEELKLISEKINELFENPSVYHKMSQCAITKSTFFSEDNFENESMRIISN